MELKKEPMLREKSLTRRENVLVMPRGKPQRERLQQVSSQEP
jgi:hypothetical protein